MSVIDDSGNWKYEHEIEYLKPYWNSVCVIYRSNGERPGDYEEQFKGLKYEACLEQAHYLYRHGIADYLKRRRMDGYHKRLEVSQLGEMTQGAIQSFERKAGNVKDVLSATFKGKTRMSGPQEILKSTSRKHHEMVGRWPLTYT